MKKLANRHIRQFKPRLCEKILNYNGFYPTATKGARIAFIDDLGRDILLPRGCVPWRVFDRIARENHLEIPCKCF